MESILPTVTALAKILKTFAIDYRFVGGVSFGGLLNEKTTWKIDIKKRRITLNNFTNLSLYRKDKTKRDIDVLLFEKDKGKIKKLRDAIAHDIFDTTTIESAIYYPEKINPLLQFVTAITIDKKGVPSLVFGSLEQPISSMSLEPWTLVIGDVQLRVRNPIADFFAYQVRSPSGVKPKDRSKIVLLKNLAEDVIKKGQEEHTDFWSENYYGPWRMYTQNLVTTTDLQIKVKKAFMKWYWDTIGPSLAHGFGLSGKLYSSLSSQFTGVQQ